jgi:Zn-dependent M28 family amino/carboxypeptidase
MISLLLASALVFSPEDAKLSYNTANMLVAECTPRDAGTPRGKIAAYRILDAASAAGADVKMDTFRAETPKGERTFTNLVAEFRGDPEAAWVVLLSHYDTKSGVDCPGANDGASTSGLMVGLANALTSWKKPRGNVMMIWTDGEECMETYSECDGLWGAKHAADKLAADGRKVKAVICMDMIGDRDLEITIPSNGSPALAKIACYAAKRIGEEKLVKLMPEHVTDDNVPFGKKGYKTINLIDFSYGSAPGLNDYWHTPKDTMDKISEASLLKSGRLVAEMLNILL